MLARVGRLLPYNCQIANHSNHNNRPALSFSSINSFSWSRDGNEMDLTIHGDDWSKTFTVYDVYIKCPLIDWAMQWTTGQYNEWQDNTMNTVSLKGLYNECPLINRTVQLFIYFTIQLMYITIQSNVKQSNVRQSNNNSYATIVQWVQLY